MDKDASAESIRNETLQNAETYLERKQKPKPLICKFYYTRKCLKFHYLCFLFKYLACD